MSEDSQDKGFKPLKLTAFKSAQPAVPAPEPASEPAVEPLAPAAPAPEKQVAAKPASLNLMSFKPGKSAKPAESADGGESGGAATTPPPALSPSAASSPALKPFKVMTPISKANEPAAAPEASSAKPQEIRLSTKASAQSLPSAGVEPAVTPVPPPVPPSVGLSLTKASSASGASKGTAVEAAAPAKAPVANASRKPLVIVAVVAVLLVVLGGVAFSLLSGGSGDSAVPIAPVAKSADAPPAAPADASSSPVSVGTSGAGATETPGVSEPAPSGIVAAPKVRRQELVDWLASTTVTAVATQRVTLNGKVYSLNAVVNSEGGLRWIGRDSVTRNLLFMDDSGVIYTKSTVTAPK